MYSQVLNMQVFFAFIGFADRHFTCCSHLQSPEGRVKSMCSSLSVLLLFGPFWVLQWQKTKVITYKEVKSTIKNNKKCHHCQAMCCCFGVCMLRLHTSHCLVHMHIWQATVMLLIVFYKYEEMVILLKNVCIFVGNTQACVITLSSPVRTFSTFQLISVAFYRLDTKLRSEISCYKHQPELV